MGTVQIRGGEPVYGNVNLSGDPYSSMFLIIKSLFADKNAKVENVPRCKVVLDCVEILKDLGIDVNWVDETTISIAKNRGIKQEIQHLREDDEYGFAQILIPLILFYKRTCIISTSLRNEAKFYRKLGFSVVSKGGVLQITSSVKNPVQKSIDVRGASPYTVASRLFVKEIHNGINVIYDQDDPMFKGVMGSQDEPNETSGRTYIASYNQKEFNLYSTLGAFSGGEVAIKNFDLTGSLPFLLAVNELGVEYEVSGKKLKIWRQEKKLNDIYDWSSHQIDALGYLLLMLSLYSKKQIRVIYKVCSDVEQLVTEMNIIGGKIDISEGGENVVLSIKPVSLSPVKTSLMASHWGGVLLVSAVLAPGKSKIQNFSMISNYVPSLVDNLRNLHVDIVST